MDAFPKTSGASIPKGMKRFGWEKSIHVWDGMCGSKKPILKKVRINPYPCHFCNSTSPFIQNKKGKYCMFINTRATRDAN